LRYKQHGIERECKRSKKKRKETNKIDKDAVFSTKANQEGNKQINKKENYKREQKRGKIRIKNFKKIMELRL
jgi:hypothetical protein